MEASERELMTTAVFLEDWSDRCRPGSLSSCRLWFWEAMVMLGDQAGGRLEAVAGILSMVPAGVGQPKWTHNLTCLKEVSTEKCVGNTQIS